MNRRSALLATVAMVVAAATAGAAPRVLEARVITVADGDSITVLDSNRLEHRVRLAGIDAPEYGQPFSDQSRKILSRAVLGKDVRLEWSKRDAYGRFVAKVWVAPAEAPCAAEPCPKTLDVGLAQLTVGQAWHYKRYEHEQTEEDRHRYAFAEEEARARKAGLWRDQNNVPPSEWRAGMEKGPIKKSRASICHGPDSPSYGSTKRFESYPTVESCIASGGRLPRESGG